ncbi:hypothetical protein AN478_06400 [Thiohalorhabdus denitrificans]|uniref:Sulfotransferase family protein n=1 Tax=Thiohalorhabdus denitrificans TaxID=381306 RepID=A0A0P9CBW2_9GAMM|nr:hypothetical protein [Thiohalorhabdus denitrificans]KPV40420.1 hypothetical protein AN478_06400 [Thiohalorhabdus denitrificans]SCY60355.1 hypothetical protein SAMN05661077_2643 [Thiohalorhabdus denitrificans]
MNTLIHIGIPKTVTTSLQKDFFAKHPEIHYLGVGADGEIGYADAEIERIFEHLLLYARAEAFEKERDLARDKIREQADRATEAGKKALVLSLEWLSFRFTPDMVDTRTMAMRLREIFGPGATVFALLRRQDHFLWSLYNEYVKHGLPMGWVEFLDYIYKFRERNFFPDLCYNELVESYAGAFGEPNVRVGFLEEYREQDGSLKTTERGYELTRAVARILGVSEESPALEHHNPSLSPEVLGHKLALNRSVRHDFGNLLFEHATLHRQRTAHGRDRNLLDLDIYRDVRKKRLLIQEAQARAHVTPPDLSETRMDPSVPVYRWLMQQLREANASLAAHLGRALPEGYDLETE